jgi:pimeloyl-ACP methyl ester carboxylesterase
MATETTAPDTIVLIHGFWVTPRSWETWIEHYQKRGFTVLAPAYPGFEVEVEALNADPSPVAALTAPAIVAKLEGVVSQLPAPPILIGHSAGGAFTQVLLVQRSNAKPCGPRRGRRQAVEHQVVDRRLALRDWRRGDSVPPRRLRSA